MTRQQLIDELRHHVEAGTEDSHEGRLALFKAVITAPIEFIAALQRGGMLPSAIGYREDGTPVLPMIRTCLMLDISLDEAEAAWAEVWPGIPMSKAEHPLCSIQ